MNTTDKQEKTTPEAAKQNNGEAKPVKKHKRAKSTHALPLFNLVLSVAIISATAFAAYKGWQQIQNQQSLIQTQQQQLQQITSTQAQVSQGVQNQLQHNTLVQNTELTTLKETIAAFLKQNQLSRRDWLIAEAEYLIKLANHRLVLAHDVPTSIQALQAADERLLEVGNPKFIPLRKALAVDIQKLNAVPQLDIVGISLKLNALQQQVETLPLITPDPKTIEQRSKAESHVSKADSWQQLPRAIWQDLLKLVHIQQHNEAIKPLLLPEQHFFLVQNLKLQLEQARLALLNQHPVIYKDRIQQAQQWISLYFDKQHSLTQTVNSALTKLADTSITQNLPDISNSLTNLQLLNPGNKHLIKAAQPTKKSTPKAKAKSVVKKPIKKKLKPKQPKPKDNKVVAEKTTAKKPAETTQPASKKTTNEIVSPTETPATKN